MEKIFFENDDLYAEFNKMGIDTRLINKQLNIITKKQKNNKVGYFQFKYNEIYIKLYVVPKIFIKSENVLEDFFKYIKKYYTIFEKYDQLEFGKISRYFIEDNYIDLGINKQNSNYNNFDELMSLKYLNVLKRIEEFYIQFNFKNCIYKDYSNSNIKYRLNVRKNITEVDKTKIHQLKKIRNDYSKIAQITMQAIKYFSIDKCDAILTNKDVINTVLRIESLIRKKFKIINTNIKIQQFFTHSIKRLFSHYSERSLYNDLSILIGAELHDTSDGDKSILLKLGGFKFIAFEPEKIYEFIVYDKLQKKYSNECKVHFIKDRSEGHILANKDSSFVLFVVDLKYRLNNDKDVNYLKETIETNPDFLIEGKTKKIIGDAKWKIIKSMSDILESDLDKLKRDCLHWGSNEGILIYPIVEDKELINTDNSIKVSDSRFKNEIFYLSLVQVSVL